MTIGDGSSQSLLKIAFEQFVENIQAAREAIDDPALKPPPPTDRNLAEGYKYLLGYLYTGAERILAEDVDVPYFRRAFPPVGKATWDNSDGLYLAAKIDADQSYLVRGNAHDVSNWAGRPAAKGQCAPQYVMFAPITQYTGDTGNLLELRPETTLDCGFLDSGNLIVDGNGYFEILISPARPKDYAGNFISTKTNLPSGDERAATYLVCRQFFSDWENEYNLDLEIENLNKVGCAPPPLTPAIMAEKLDRFGRLVNNQMRFWNQFYAIVLNGYGDSPIETPVSYKGVNILAQPNIPSGGVGAAPKSSIYSGGTFELTPGEALIVEQNMPEAPAYGGFSLCNIWGQSLDYENNTTSISNGQMSRDKDGAIRYVVSERDPGINNWLNTTGLDRGLMTLRWIYYKQPSDLPTVKIKKVLFDDISAHLPDDTPMLEPGARQKQIAIRQRHCQRRFRQS
ncbi:MAG: hypothetical protein AAF950_17680 [Pseudomonadota bacterium]